MQTPDKFYITGGNQLNGKVIVDGAKNSALSIMAASLLSREVSVLENVPRLKDVYSMIEVIKILGVKVEWIADNTLSIDPDDFNNYEAPYELVKTMRASFLVMGPLLARLKKAKISLPGGCAIGARPVDFHLKGFRFMGADITTEKGYIKAEVKKLKGNDIYLDFPSLGATENIMMAASLADGTTTIENAAKDPIAGAPLIAIFLIASATSSYFEQLIISNVPGSFLWSIINTLLSFHSIVFIIL